MYLTVSSVAVRRTMTQKERERARKRIRRCAEATLENTLRNYLPKEETIARVSDT